MSERTRLIARLVRNIGIIKALMLTVFMMGLAYTSEIGIEWGGIANLFLYLSALFPGAFVLYVMDALAQIIHPEE